MLYALIKSLLPWLEAHELGFLRVFTFAEFQSLLAVAVSFLTVLLLGPPVIRFLAMKKIGDRPDFDQADINKLMNSKEGTPTMGGVLIIAAIVLSVVLLGNLSNFYVLMALMCVVVLGGIGAVDDWLKLTRKPGNRQGLTTLEKLLFQIGLAVVLCYFTWGYGQNLPESNRLYVPFFKEVAVPLGLGAFTLIGVFVLVGASNAVNLTDGLDGLAAGCMSIVSFAFLVLSLLVGLQSVADFLYMPYIKAADQMAVVCGAMLGSCMGFLWYNCNPARVFMGDTGSLALGGLIGYVAIVTRQELMLALVGGVFVAEALSVMLQVGYFKYTRRRFGEGRRIFRMAPLHHHFQKLGWTETQVVVRFWLVGALLAALALATIKLR
ncbi:MAG: phospho-N-acetylmuramoyl-pentapeptide-transferase [Tepidisphaerales bacterium]